ncbi:hypothetical protein SNE40_019034 [Patella caerulea]|uniref:Syntaxin-binding protein 5-like n=1 Tax=Patella caerulea TaxID=87958 RepID=A0AAN8P531_PATCE
MKRFTLKGVLDGLRSSVSTAPKSETEIEESLQSQHFQICKTVRYGFPFHPTAVAFDPVQHILAIGTKSGSLRIIGQSGVDCQCEHFGDVAVSQILFLANEGALVTVCSDDSLHLWNLRQKRPEIVHSLKFQRERITYCHLPFQSKWLYIGTERGNVHLVNIESFILSGYVINWNKAIELSRKTHPGPVVHLSDNPVDSSKLLIGFESGAVVLWDLKTKVAEHRFPTPEALRSIAWQHEGKQFMCSHSDGSLTTWGFKTPQKPTNIMLPHAKIGKDGKPDPCKPITKIDWKSVRNGGEGLIIFSGGMSYDRAGRTPCITVMNGKSTTVLEMEHNVVDFVVLCETPWANDFQDPYAIVVLLQNDLVVVDLTTQGYPCFENPYPMDIHESPVTACQYYADCPPDLIPAFYSVGSKTQKKSGFSEKAWPIQGGEWGTTTCSYPEIIITGHADGSLKFWDASAVTLQILYKLKTAKMFEKPKRNVDVQDEDPFAIQIIYLCQESRWMCVAGATHVMLCKFCKHENTIDIPMLEVSIVYEINDELDSPEYDYPKPSLSVVATQQSGSMGSYSSNTSDSGKEPQTLVRVKGGGRKWGSGYHPDLVCVLTFVDGEPPGSITSVSINSSYGVMAFGNESGIAIIDVMQKTCLLNLGTPDLYGSMDPYQRAPRSPRNKTAASVINSEDCKSPVADQSTPCQPDLVTPIPPPRRKSKKTDVDQLSMPAVTSEICDEDINNEIPFTPYVVIPKNGEINTPNVFMNDINKDNNRDKNSKEISESVEICSKDDNKIKNKPKVKSKSTSCVEKKSKGLKLDINQKIPLSKSSSDESDKHIKIEAPATAVITNKPHPLLRRSSSDPDPSVGIPAPPRKISEHEQLQKLNITSEEDSESESKDVFDIKNNNHKMAADKHTTSHDNHSKTFMRKMSSKMSFKIRQLAGMKTTENDDSHAHRHSEKEKEKPKSSFKVDVVDLSSENAHKPSVRRMSVSDILHSLKVDRNDGSSFSRSRSSSMSSIENVSKEAIQCLTFADSYTRKTDNFTCPCLYVGTSLGSVIVIVLNLPTSEEQRATQPVIVSPSGTIFRLKGSILAMSFLDCNGVLIPSQCEHWKESPGNPKEARDMTRDERALKFRQMSVTSKQRISPTSSTELCDRQFGIICSEKQARVMSLPSQTCAYKAQITENSFVVRAEVVSVRESVCLMCYVANGRILAYSLPSLKPLLNVDFLPLTDYRVARTFCFSNSGHALYLCSPTEIQKITYSSEICDNLNEMLGDLFLPCETPEAPKQSFFKNLFGGGTGVLDREELFGESSGKASKGLAKHIPGSGGMAHLKAESTGIAGDLARTRLALNERGEKLGDLDDRSAQMMAQAESFAQAAHQIMNKYKDKKWYQF